MSTPYEVEHNVVAGQTGQHPRGRRVDMASFYSFLSQISTNVPPGGEAHHNPHAEATPVDTANLLRLLQDQLATILQSGSSSSSSADGSDGLEPEHRALLQDLIGQVDDDISGLPRLHGVTQAFLDALDRVDRKEFSKGKKGEGEKCPICAERFADDPHPLVVELPCHSAHRFDLECIAPWLQSKGTCPICRKDFVKKKEKEAKKPDEEEDEEEEYETMYG